MIGAASLRMAALLGGAVALVLVLAVLAYGAQQRQAGYQQATDQHTAAIATQQAQAAALLAAETAKVHTAEATLAQALKKREVQDAHNQHTIDNLRTQLQAAAVATGGADAPRLRDPFWQPAQCAPGGPGGGGTGSQTAAAAGAGAADAAAPGGLLSEELTGLLQRLLADADAISAAYTSCRTDAYTVRGEQPPP